MVVVDWAFVAFVACVFGALAVIEAVDRCYFIRGREMGETLVTHPHQCRWETLTGEEPSFRENRQAWRGERAHVRCVECRGRSWVTRAEWGQNRADAPQPQGDGDPCSPEEADADLARWFVVLDQDGDIVTGGTREDCESWWPDAVEADYTLHPVVIGAAVEVRVIRDDTEEDWDWEEDEEDDDFEDDGFEDDDEEF